MDVYRRIKDVPIIEETVLTIGSFDGLHRGHQEVVRRVVTTAKAVYATSVVVTFHPHPKTVLMDGEDFELLMNMDKKLELLEIMGVDVTLVVPFDKEFAATPAPEFLETVLVGKFNPSRIIVGYDHRFGHERKGDGKFLSLESDNYGYALEIVSSVGDQDVIYSSSRLRKLIKEGHVRRASYDLGWVYGFDATVVHGSGRGHDLDYPTANFVPKFDQQLLPCPGVYLARGTFGHEWLYGMANLGTRPTFGEKDFVMEIHLFNGQVEDLYDQTIEVQFLERIRDEKKFSSAEKLVEQLHKDKAYCLERIDIYKQENR
ncbi:MAG TPA: bifunctional riboflavin kinase/FAD synthetase [Candidatus Marinimicrobia bacterium]|nr:bifunctional riboflavin kinase/FAD synthetase [Candidatus Neomarinimicrobiota bacterium]